MKQLLVIDDSAVIRKIARRVAEAEGLRVTDAESCDEGLIHCEKDMPDVILLDRGVSGMTAFDFLQRLRSSPEGARPRVIYCSIETDLLHMAIALRTGASDFIIKPFEVNTMRSKLRLAVAA